MIIWLGVQKTLKKKTKWTADDFKEKKSSFTPTVSSPPKIFNRDLKTPTPTVAPTPQPIQSNFIDSYLKPFQPSNNADVPIGAPFQVNPDNKPLPAVENLSFTPVKKYGHAITPDNKGLIMPGPVTRKEGPQYNNAP